MSEFELKPKRIITVPIYNTQQQQQTEENKEQNTSSSSNSSSTSNSNSSSSSTSTSLIPSSSSSSSTSPLPSSSSFTFVIGADPQLGISSGSLKWEYEIEYSLRAITYINNMTPKPSFVCLCGDLIDMEPSIFKNRYNMDDCIRLQNEQFNDFKRIWSQLNHDIPLLCLCGNHDVGNTPTIQSIQRYISEFGDDYYAFLYKTTYCICLNTNLYNDNSLAFELYETQHSWLQEQLQYAKNINAEQIFLFGHHPWFLKHENETESDLVGVNYIPNSTEEFVPDSYFHIKLEWRRHVMQLCYEYNVTACFAGHYHQNLITHSSWGMPMIITGGICNWNMMSTGKDMTIPDNAINGAGVRIVTVDKQYERGFTHTYQLV